MLAACGDSAPPPADQLVGNTRGNTIIRLNSATGVYVGEFIAVGSGGPKDPGDLTVGPDGNLCVGSGTRTTGQILRYNGPAPSWMSLPRAMA